MNPLRSFVHANRAFLTGRLRFPRERVGEVIPLPDGTHGRVFRQALHAPADGQPTRPEARFHGRFYKESTVASSQLTVNKSPTTPTPPTDP